MSDQNMSVRTIVYPVTDLEKAKALYTALLGTPPATDQPWYVGWRVGGQDVGLDPNGDPAAGPLAYWHVADVRATLAALLEAGAQQREDVRDVGGGKLVASVTDPDGNVVALLQEG
jgi:predicted enzyme related to lactoylglutathione lyase